MKKGFTLIELLAVIVLLAIIATIATPIILNIIDDAKISSVKNSASSYLKAVELFISNANINNKKINFGAYPITDDGNVCIGVIEENKCIGEIVKIEIKGRKAENGKITINEKGIEIDYLEINGYVYYKDNDQYKVENGKEIISESNTETIILEDSSVPYLTNYRIYGNEISGVGDYDETTGKYKISVKAIGKNILNIDDLLNAPSQIVNGIAVKNYLTLNLKPNTIYTMSSDVYGSLSGTADKNRCLYFNDTVNTASVFKDKPVKITTDNEGTLLILLLSDRSAAQPILNKEAYIQIEEGDTATDYEPYVEPKEYNIYLDKPLRCVEEVCDYIDYESEKVIRYIGENLEILSEPVIETIELPKISINDGVSNISIETDVKPSKFSVNYYK